MDVFGELEMTDQSSPSQQPAISVVIAVRDRAELLREALISIQNQTLSDWECIVVDDYSHDDLQVIVSSFNEPRFRYHRNPGKAGVSAARNYGNRQAKADWIAVADSDDINLPNRLEATLHYLSTHPDTDVIYGTIYAFKTGESSLEPWGRTQSYNRELLYSLNFIPHNSVTYRRALVNAIGYDEELEGAEDYDLWLSLADRHARFAFIAETMVLYRRHADQFSTDPVRKSRMYDNSYKVMAAHARFKSAE